MKATYEDWQQARKHPWHCDCDLCHWCLDQIEPALLSKFKARARLEKATQ